MTKTLDGTPIMLVRPSSNNLHTFTAEEDSCFFDICLPNYTTDSLRRITYFSELPHKQLEAGNEETEENAADTAIEYGLPTSNTTRIRYDVTPPKFPVGFEITELDYRGDYKEAEKLFTTGKMSLPEVWKW